MRRKREKFIFSGEVEGEGGVSIGRYNAEFCLSFLVKLQAVLSAFPIIYRFILNIIEFFYSFLAQLKLFFKQASF